MKKHPRPPDILRKGGPHKNKKHEEEVHPELFLEECMCDRSPTGYHEFRAGRTVCVHCGERL